MTLFDEITQTKHYQVLLNQLPEDERQIILTSLKDLVENFEKGVIEPIKNHNSK